jgi:FkbM family methyltransferase
MNPLRVCHVPRTRHLGRYIGLYILCRLGERARRERHPKMAVIAHDHIGNSIVMDGRYETDILNVVTGWLLPRALPGHTAAIALDVGANIGNHTLAFARMFAKVLAFEPNSIAIYLLRANVEMNQVANVEIYPFGLGRTDGQLHYESIQGNLGAGRFLMECETSDVGRLLDVRNGDAFMRKRREERRVGLVKVDVEGMEAAVLEGLSEVLRRHKPIVLFEALAPDAYLESTMVLRRVGYTHFFALERRNSYLPCAPVRAILRLFRGADVLLRPLDHVTNEVHSVVVASVGADWVG